MAIYQEKNRNKITKDGRCWYFRCYYTDMYGNRKQKKSKLYRTKGEAKIEESSFLSKINIEDKVDYNITFNNVYDDWLNYKSKLLKSTTFYGIKKC